MEIAYLVCKSELPFTNYCRILETMHGVDYGSSAYANDSSAALFADYIGKAMQQDLVDSLNKCKFY